MLEIKNVHAEVDGKEILKGITLTIKPGEIHAIMGPNGSGKSTLSKVLAGHPSYEVTDGEVYFKGQSLLELSPDERSHLGFFMSFQYPIEIPGVSNVQFLRAAVNYKRKAEGKPELTETEFKELLDAKMKEMEIPSDFSERNVNEGFSGGEKKRNEILQMAMLDPSFAILDETDSGLDIDALKVVARGVTKLMNPKRGLILITHYQRLLDYIKPDHVHVMSEGKIVQSGDASLAHELEKRGYDWIV